MKSGPRKAGCILDLVSQPKQDGHASLPVMSGSVPSPGQRPKAGLKLTQRESGEPCVSATLAGGGLEKVAKRLQISSESSTQGPPPVHIPGKQSDKRT